MPWLTLPYGFPIFLGVRSSHFSSNLPPLYLLSRPRSRPTTICKITSHSPPTAAGAYTFARSLLLIIPNIRPSQLASPLSPHFPSSLGMNSQIISLPPPSTLPPLQHLAAPMPCESGAFVLSSNPPNPKANFRFGDWMYVASLAYALLTTLVHNPVITSCPSVSCAAHNFGYISLATLGR